ncbi:MULTISPECIES: sulfate ABC transporter substrate-binding protein [unclassified Paenibacillus]|uniref:sulfate ABC transporter substrate-binding protein n=1 Tax=unclassified Paenibacillus TaxID=185978 RepID=UPI002406154C|nr:MULTISPECIES: sulfate ABC transporter substrate-binding protein [unclassified Paenibacillus]MDF9841987.1 sulfate/thiosulfate-binding protein [Paenibacillus sp. PastF-2]MDF9848759.1 sulfate/thiosulfate-binding protein [Paenibacillus sp. PastM-2]MDF9855329.1 sulfate/thiosulfate-binding protein [Paenibacillus sp. PastF-1]MDH6480599.1 sulfate/thiosulfate-binding protein [Paenibacillus sp. PastH-2]MDH6508025.1 sulfate/thiosulfate-binding protein [Paenibacillus sp. PastM-3]
MRVHKRSRQLHGWLAALMLALLALALAGCGDSKETADGEAAPQQGDLTLVVGAYSVVKDAMGDILPLFAADWKAKTGQTIVFQESYEASGTQARAIAGGFEADVTLLALEGDIEKLVKAGLVADTWKEHGADGMITRSVVALGTREGNPKGIKDFSDLAKPGVKVLYPNPKTSGGAQWDINAIYGAGLKMSEEQTGVKDTAAAKAFLEQVHANVESLDKSGRASMAAFEYGVGDVIVTYENELLARIAKGVKYEVIIPKDTILIENPAAVVDKYVDERGTREAAEALVDYLSTPAAQEVFAEHGFRPVNEQVYAANESRYPVPAGLFGIDYLGGWTEVRETLYSKRGVWYQVLAGI